MESITLKEIAGYLPYDLKQCHNVENPKESNVTIVTLKNVDALLNYKESGKSYFKPILYPLPMLTQEIEHNGEKFVPIERIAIYEDINYLLNQIKCGLVEQIVYEMLLKWHLDVNGLITRGLAIDKTTLKK